MFRKRVERVLCKTSARARENEGVGWESLLRVEETEESPSLPLSLSPSLPPLEEIEESMSGGGTKSADGKEVCKAPGLREMQAPETKVSASRQQRETDAVRE